MTDALLIERLRRDAQAAIDTMWQTTRADAEAVRAQSAREIEAAREQCARDGASRAAQFEHASIAAAERAARSIRTSSTAAIAERLHALAGDALHRFRHAGYDELFDALASELPSLEYQEVSVNPQDAERARARYPRAQVIADPSIIGGLEATAEGGRIRISNTLATRLDSAWPWIIAGALRELRESADGR